MKELLRHLPELEKIHYLNYAATAPLLAPAGKAMLERIDEAKEPLQFHRDSWLSILEKARREVSGLIGASPEEIAFVSSTSHGLSAVANAILWKRGDEVVYPADEFPSNRYVWQNLEKKGVEPIAILPD